MTTDLLCFDKTSMALLLHIPVRGYAIDIAYWNDRLYICNMDANRIEIYSEEGRPLRTIRGGGNPLPGLPAFFNAADDSM